MAVIMNSPKTCPLLNNYILSYSCSSVVLGLVAVSSLAINVVSSENGMGCSGGGVVKSHPWFVSIFVRCLCIDNLI
jgi:hypothetical protein